MHYTKKQRNVWNEWYKKNADREKKKWVNYSRTLQGRWTLYKNECRTKRRIFDISFTQYQLLMKEGCFYCKSSLLDSSGICLDRVDNSKNKGYTIENVLPCCGTCNNIRGNNLTVEEMKIAMNAILEFRKYR